MAFFSETSVKHRSTHNPELNIDGFKDFKVTCKDGADSLDQRWKLIMLIPTEYKYVIIVILFVPL